MLKKIHLLGWDIFMENEDGTLNLEGTQNLIAAQITDEATAKGIQDYRELEVENGKLVRAIDCSGNIKVERQLKKGEMGMEIPDYPPNKLLKFDFNELGFHQLGGEIPDTFKMPDNDCIVPFQYLGYFDNNEANFAWLPFRLHLVCPIFLNFDKVFLDYTHPNYPILLNREEVEDADTSYEEDLDKTTEIVYNELKFNTIETHQYSSRGMGGIPNWIQYPDLPICPKSNKPMKFLCQMSGGVSAKRSNVVPHIESFRGYYEHLNFWCDGDLFVFVEPESKVVCYL